RKHQPGTSGVVLNGLASYYSSGLHGHRTANGERYNMHSLTAAHPHLPFNTIVEVTNLTNKKSVKVRINDRGPFKKGRIIDLSYEAAQRIGMVKKGVVAVRLKICLK
ncbi:MAG: septal ring lytic transglycosylase RlpA family protein, partial [Chitinivibrionales bacterium]|nr:septal ring lytic transglycosylase RlpA family protein [Chitinivibrionales bacterium]